MAASMICDIKLPAASLRNRARALENSAGLFPHNLAGLSDSPS